MRIRLVALLLATTLLPAVPVQAHYDIRGWTQCSYNWLTDWGRDIVVGYDPSYPFPADTVQDGVLNSFTGRIAGAVAQWDYHILHSTAAPGPGGMAYAGPNWVDVRMRYADTGTDGPAGYESHTYRLSSQTGCAIHATPPTQIYVSTIVIDRLPDWFTQDDSRRSLWEACPTQGGPSYTCSKTLDVQETMTHELGHSLGLPHPFDVDKHIEGTAIEAYNTASCADPARKATMCSGASEYATARRTLAQWDVDSLAKHYLENWT